jgi:hypothetical protein
MTAYIRLGQKYNQGDEYRDKSAAAPAWRLWACNV